VVDDNIAFLIGTLVPTVVGTIGLTDALRTYREGQVLKRKDIIMPLIEQFDSLRTYSLQRQYWMILLVIFLLLKQKMKFLRNYWISLKRTWNLQYIEFEKIFALS
jgi:hypothetical protein